MKEYEGFSKQDLKDRLHALEKEHEDLVGQRMKVYSEILKIDKLLEKMTKK